MDDDREYYHRREFGFPYGRLIFPLIIGIILILWGVSDLFGIDLWRYIWPIIAIVLGILIILGAVFGRHRS